MRALWLPDAEAPKNESRLQRSEKTTAKGLEELGYVLRQISLEPYWSRVWVFQELKFAQAIRVFYGDHVLDWELLLESERNVVGTNISMVRDPVGRSRRLKMLEMIHKCAYGQKLSGEDIIWIAELQCLDSRDRVFGTMEVLNWGNLCPPPVVDYNKQRGTLAVELLCAMRTSEGAGLSNCVGSGCVTYVDYIIKALELTSASESDQISELLMARRRSARSRLTVPTIDRDHCLCSTFAKPNTTARISNCGRRILSMDSDSNQLQMEGNCHSRFVPLPGHLLVLSRSHDGQCYEAHIGEGSAASLRYHHSCGGLGEPVALFSGDIAAGDYVVDASGEHGENLYLVCRQGMHNHFQIVGHAVFNWAYNLEELFRSVDTTPSLCLHLDVEDLLLSRIHVRDPQLDQTTTEGMQQAFRRLEPGFCRTRFSSFVMLGEIEPDPRMCIQCGGSQTLNSRESSIGPKAARTTPKTSRSFFGLGRSRPKS
jgi:hypothetical protein